MSDDRPTKSCPDCAETVLAAASKCRFCGYRFEPAPSPAPSGGPGGVLSLLRREASRPPLRLQDLLDSWGITPGDDDPEPALFNGSIAGVFGFIVVSETRLYFVPATRASKAVRVSEQHEMSDLLRVHRRRHRLRRALFLEWRNTRTIVTLDGGQLRALHDLLGPRALIQSHEG